MSRHVSRLRLSEPRELEIPNKLFSLKLHTYLSHQRLVLKTNEGDSCREVSEGLPQGCPLFSILFLGPPLNHIGRLRTHPVQDSKFLYINVFKSKAIACTRKATSEVRKVKPKQYTPHTTVEVSSIQQSWRMSRSNIYDRKHLLSVVQGALVLHSIGTTASTNCVEITPKSDDYAYYIRHRTRLS